MIFIHDFGNDFFFVAEKRAQAVAAAQLASSTNTKTTMSYTSAIMTAGRATKMVTTSTTQTFAAKLSEITASAHTLTTVMPTLQSIANNKQKSSQGSTSTGITVMSSTAPTTPQTSPQQTASSTSPKHCRPLPTLSAPPTMPSSHYTGKPAYSPGSNGSLPSMSTGASTGPENVVASTSASSVRVTPSPPAVTQHSTMQQQQQLRSSTPIATTMQEQQQQSASTPLEYSLFNDTFTKVTQQSMWGGRESESQKGMNFATVAGGGVTVNTSGSSNNKFIDSVPPQVCWSPIFRLKFVTTGVLKMQFISFISSGGCVQGPRIQRDDCMLAGV